MTQDWFDWHQLYNTETVLQQRLAIVQQYIAASLDAAPPGPIRVVSACAGDGRDLLGVLANHPRAQDVRARLVELNPKLVEQGRAVIAHLGLSDNIEFLQGDAALTASYAGAVPADVVILCGIFGNLPDETVLEQLVRNLPYFAKPGAFALWTRGHLNGDNHSQRVRQIFQVYDFSEVEFQLTATGNMGVGRHRFIGQTRFTPLDEQFFTFTGTPDRTRLILGHAR